MRNNFLWIASIIACLCMGYEISHSQIPVQVTLGWNPSTSTGVMGYNVYYGTESGQYTNHLQTTNTYTTVSNLTPGVVYYFAINSFDANSNVSNLSSEIAWENGIPLLDYTLSVPQAGSYAIQESPSLTESNWQTIIESVSAVAIAGTPLIVGPGTPPSGYAVSFKAMPTNSTSFYRAKLNKFKLPTHGLE